MASFLLNHFTIGDQRNLPTCLVIDCTPKRSNRVHILNFTAGAELFARPTNTHVCVDPHRAFLHACIGGTNFNENRSEFIDVLSRLLRGSDIRSTHDLDERHAGTIEIDERALASMNSTRTANVGALAGVFFEVCSLDADDDAVSNFKMTVNVERTVILRDLVRLRHIGIEVILSRKGARLNGAIECEADSHRQLDSLTVEHRQGARQTERHRVNIGVRIISKTIRRA